LTALVRFQGVALNRGGRLLVEGLDLALGHGDALHVRGPNGSGKSSLIRLAAGLLQPTAGTVSSGDRVGLIDENFPFDLERSVADELAFWLGLDKVPASLVEDALAAFGIGHLATVPMRLLSTGQRKRAAFAGLWADNSVIWLLDEPMNGLDEEGAQLVRREIAAHKAGGNAVIYASHLPLDLHDEQVQELGR
jgi:heme exporter protein A